MPDRIAQIKAALVKPSAATSDFDLNPDVLLPANRQLRQAGVLVAVICDGADFQIYLTKRSSALEHHPGQIAFPGGKRESQDVDITATALREASEEIGLDPANAQVLGQLPPHETVTGFLVTPVVAQVLKPFTPLVERGEVEEVFLVPLSHLMDISYYSVQSRRWRGSARHYYTVPFGPYYIWGATARILRAMADVAKPA